MASFLRLLGGKTKSKSSKRASSASIENDDEYEVLSHDGNTAHAASTVHPTSDRTTGTDTENRSTAAMSQPIEEEVIELDPSTPVVVKTPHFSDKYTVAFLTPNSTQPRAVRTIPATRALKIRVSALQGQDDLLVLYSAWENLLIVLRMPVSSESLDALKSLGAKITGETEALGWYLSTTKRGWDSPSWRAHVIAKNKKLGPRSAENEGYTLLQGKLPSLDEVFKAYFLCKTRSRWRGKQQGLKKTEVGVHGELEFEVHCPCEKYSWDQGSFLQVFAKGLVELKDVA